MCDRTRLKQAPDLLPLDPGPAAPRSPYDRSLVLTAPEPRPRLLRPPERLHRVVQRPAEAGAAQCLLAPVLG
jgi:hypothetical protein